jgi:hypothetical protein
MDQAPDGLVSLLQNRVGRYPEPDDRPDPSLGLGETYEGVFGDANAPVVGGWFHNRFYIAAKARKPIKLEDGREIRDRVFFQPPGILADGSANPNAENLHNLRKIKANYYAQKLATMDDYDINRLLMCNPGWSRYGKPVHEHFDHLRHVAAGPIEPDANLVLRIGADCGNTLKPAATFSQRSFSSQHRVWARSRRWTGRWTWSSSARRSGAEGHPVSGTSSTR